MTAAKALVSEWNRMGSQMRFFVGTLAGIPDALMHYRGELLRVIAQMGLGTGVLAVIGGTVAIVGFLAMTTGAIVAVQGYNQFASVGVEALTGFASAFFNTREIQPGTVMVALAATVGAGTTAALGAMRINEEIDALEVIGIRSISSEHPGAGRSGRGRPSVLCGTDDGLPGRARRHHRHLWPGVGRVRPLLQHVPAPDRRALVVG